MVVTKITEEEENVGKEAFQSFLPKELSTVFKQQNKSNKHVPRTFRIDYKHK